MLWLWLSLFSQLLLWHAVSAIVCVNLVDAFEGCLALGLMKFVGSFKGVQATSGLARGLDIKVTIG